MGLSGSGEVHARPSRQPPDRADGRGDPRARRGRHGHERSGAPGAPRRAHRHGLPAHGAAAPPDGARQRRLPARDPRRVEGAALGGVPAEARAGRTRGLRGPVAVGALGWHAAARRARPGARVRPRDPADGRAVLGARSAHPEAAPGPVHGALPRARQDDAVHHARSGRGDPSRGPHRDHEGRTHRPDRHRRGHRQRSGRRLRARLRAEHLQAQARARPARSWNRSTRSRPPGRSIPGPRR